MPSLLPPALPAGVDGDLISDISLQLFDLQAHEGLMQVGRSWGFREGVGSTGVCVPARGGDLSLVAIEVKTPTLNSDDNFAIKIYNENNGSLLASVDFDVDLTIASGGQIVLASPVLIPAGSNIGIRYVSNRPLTPLNTSIIALWFEPALALSATLPPANPVLDAIGAREDTSYCIWASSSGTLDTSSIFSPSEGPRAEVGFNITGNAMEIWAVGFRAGHGHSTSVADISIRNASDDYNLGNVICSGPNHAQLLSTPLAYPSGTSLGFACDAVSGPRLTDPVVAVWVREVLAPVAHTTFFIQPAVFISALPFL